MKLCGFEVGLNRPLFLIAGPCVVESEQLQLEVAGRLLADGTQASPITLSGVAPGSWYGIVVQPGAAASVPHDIAGVGTSLVVFGANDGVVGDELWVSDGTAAGTRLLLDLVPGPGTSSPLGMTSLGARAVFAATDAAGIKVVVNHVRSFDPHFRRVRHLIASGAIGQVRSIMASGTKSFSTS